MTSLNAAEAVHEVSAMLAAWFEGSGTVSVRETPDPRIQAPDECLVRVAACGICGTDKRIFLALQPPGQVMGHEAAGEVVAVGDAVTTVAPGDHVAVYNLIGCGACPCCRQGRITWCAATRGSVNGGYGELLVAPERNLLRVPADLAWARACLLTDVLGTPMKAARIAPVSEGDRVVVLGCGPIGLGAVLVAVALGARVMAVDPLANRRALAARFGAEIGCDPGAADALEQVRAWTGPGADLSFDCTGAPGATLTALDCLRPGGTAMCIGANLEMSFSPWRHIISRDAKLGGSWYLHYEDFARCLALMRAGLLDPLPMVTHTVPLARIAHGFDLLINHPDECIKVLVTAEGS